MNCVSKMKFLKISGGVSKNNKAYYIMSLLDETNELYKFFAFNGTEVYKKLSNCALNVNDEVIVSLSVSSFDNRVRLEDFSNAK